jgi:hypothetical protein
MKRIYVVGTANEGRGLAFVAARVAEAGAAGARDVARTATEMRRDFSAGEVASHHPDGVSQGSRDGRSRHGGGGYGRGRLPASSPVVRISPAVIGIGGGAAPRSSLPECGHSPLAFRSSWSPRSPPAMSPPTWMSATSSWCLRSPDIAGLNPHQPYYFWPMPPMRSPEWTRAPALDGGDKPALGLTMFGVHTTCVTSVAEGVACPSTIAWCSHATGTGGRAMEKLVDSRLLVGVIDVTTTEICESAVRTAVLRPARPLSSRWPAPALRRSSRWGRWTW